MKLGAVNLFEQYILNFDLCGVFKIIYKCYTFQRELVILNCLFVKFPVVGHNIGGSIFYGKS